jgi:hypothetical protein
MKIIFTFNDLVSFFFSSEDSLVVVGGLVPIIGFFFTTTVGLDAGDSSFLFIEALSSTFFEVVTVSITISEVAERGSPLRLSRIDFSAYSLT